MSRLTFFLASGANRQGSTEEHLSLFIQLVARRTSKGRFCMLISYNRQREQSNNPSFQNEFTLNLDIDTTQAKTACSALFGVQGELK